MRRSGYGIVDDQWSMICYRGAVASAIRGKRGQAMLRELLAALDAMPNKQLISDQFVVAGGECCALGALGLARGMLPDTLNELDYEPAAAAQAFGVATALAAEIEYENDDCGPWLPHHGTEAPEDRWQRMREWVASKIAP